MKTTSLFFIVFALPVILAFIGMVTFLEQPVDRNDKSEHVFVVRPGEAVSSIAKRLKQEGLIRNDLVFLWQVKRLGIEKQMQAGDFRLAKSQTASQMAKALTTGTLDVWVQIIEGLRSEEIAEILKRQMPIYKSSWGIALRKQEGFLFPDTYLIPKDADINLIVKILTDNFDKKVEGLKDEIGKNGLSLEQTIILASIIEREGLFDEDRPIIAGILLNRLRIGMALQADATVQYALGFQKDENDWWKKNLTKEDLIINSPFNTYRFPGLPPKPIANPGLAAIKAALNSTNTDYLYYLHDKTGRTHYAKTLEQHNANVAKYLQ